MQAIKFVINTDTHKRITNTIVACNLLLETYKAMSGASKNPYTQKALEKAYFAVTKRKSKVPINYFIHRNQIYLIPETGNGIYVDTKIMSTFTRN